MKYEATTVIKKTIECKMMILREFLFRIAMGDGILSDDEIELLFSINLNLNLLHSAAFKALEDNYIDEYESKELERLIKQIENDAISTAKFDDCITHDDGRLIRILQILLIEFNKILVR